MISQAPLELFLIVIGGLTTAFVPVFARAFRIHWTTSLLGCIAWLTVTGAFPFVLHLMSVGSEAQFPVFAIMLTLAVSLAIGRVGLQVVEMNGLALLAGIHIFRLPLEFVLILWYEHGFMPVQMTWNGDNFDVVTGVLALPVAVLIAKKIRPTLIAFLFNLFGLLMLLNIVLIVALSSPTPLRTLTGGYSSGPETLVGMYFPSVWIGSVAVVGATFLHIASLSSLFRKKLAQARSKENRKKFGTLVD
ncbi:MAG: hypothetical protein AB8B79_02830 [Granulosicoccus sp.]